MNLSLLRVQQGEINLAKTSVRIYIPKDHQVAYYQGQQAIDGMFNKTCNSLMALGD